MKRDVPYIQEKYPDSNLNDAKLTNVVIAVQLI